MDDNVAYTTSVQAYTQSANENVAYTLSIQAMDSGNLTQMAERNIKVEEISPYATFTGNI